MPRSAIHTFFLCSFRTEQCSRFNYGSTTYKMPFKARSRVKMDEKLKMTRTHETATESELLNQFSRFWCHSFREKMFSHMQLKYVIISIRKVLKNDRSAFSRTPGIVPAFKRNPLDNIIVPITVGHHGHFNWTLPVAPE